jgi:hypothetical protein
MLLELCVAALLCVLGLCLIAELTQRAMRRLGIDPRSALLWLGLAERPVAPRTRQRLSELVAEPPRALR